MIRREYQWQSLGSEEIRERQVALLRQYLRHTVLPFSAHYHKLFDAHGIDAESFNTIDDLAKIPFTAKNDLLATPQEPDKMREFLLVPDPELLKKRPSVIAQALLTGSGPARRKLEREFRPIMLTSTTGRSSDPVPFLYTQHDIDNLGVSGYRVMRTCGAKREMRMINMFPFAPHLAFWITHYAGTEFGVFVLSSGGGKVMGTDGCLRLMKKIKPDVIIGMPTFIYHVLQEAAHEGMQCPNLSKVVLGGEKAPAGIRRKFEKLLHGIGAEQTDILRTYAFTEAKAAWAECPYPAGAESGGYHTSPDMGIIEVVDPHTGKRVGEGKPGEIVYTPLNARGSVVLRYRTGDVISGGLFYEPCPHCGRRVPRLVGDISRTSEIREMKLDKLKGTLVDFNELEHVLDSSERVGTWQLEIRKAHDDPLDVDEIILHVQALNGADHAQLSDELRERFAMATEIHPNKIVFHDVQEMRRMQGVGTLIKEQKIVDNRPKAAADPAAGGKA
ncbi:MAG TPA: AMP-binding protein [Chthoniobacteraceae bacterium]|nr:AMP-binding protein [Chthoniobacteraceae bacterium]